MKASVNYKVMGNSVKETKRIENLKKYIADNFTVKGKRLGIPNFVKEFGKFNDDKETLQASSVVTVKDIQTACRLLASELKANNAEVIPCVISKNGTVTIEVKDIAEFETFYPTVKSKVTKEVSPTEFIINYINKHSSELNIADIKNALSMIEE